MKKSLAALIVMLFSSTCSAQFIGSSFLSSGPSSTLGTVTNNLTLTDTANGFIVSGQVIVNVPSTSSPITGVLAEWVVDRPLAFPFGPATLSTSTLLNGFSTPPPGTVGNSTGFVETIFTDFLGTTTSRANVPLTLVAGVDVPPWNNLSVNSASFSYTATSAGQFLRQFFYLEGDYQSGPGGNWIVDVPVTSIVTSVPEPSTFAMLGVALASLAGYRVRKGASRD